METANSYLNFRFYIGGYGGNHTELQTYEGRLYYCRNILAHRWEAVTEYAEPIEVNTTELLNALLPCLNWKNRYDSPSFDGEQWTLTIQINDQSRDIYGSNNYPEDFYSVISHLEKVVQRPLLSARR